MGVPEYKGLCVIWSSSDPDVAEKLVYMYTKNSRLKGWWDNVRLVIWGPSVPALIASADLKEGLEELQAAGVETVACKACADMYGLSGDLETLGVEVKYMGQPLTDMIKEGWAVLTF